MSEQKNKIDEFLKTPTTVVLENISLTGELTHFLLTEENIKKIYIVKGDTQMVSQVRQVILNKEIVCLAALSKSDIENKEILYCLDDSNYFNPNFSLLTSQRDIKAICLLGFSPSSFSTAPKSKNCLVINSSISEIIISNKVISAHQSQTDNDKTRICHNRDFEKNALGNFLANPNERLLVMHGFPGYGKSNLLTHLKRIASNREYIPFTFESKSDTYKDIIGELSPYFSLTTTIEEIRQTEISDRNQRELVKKFCNSFNLRENSTLIFESLQKVTYSDQQFSGQFISADLRFFFELLITHNSFKSSNKIIFISRAPLQLNDEIRRFSYEIKVKELEPYYIKRIMADEFNRINRPELAVKIGTFQDDEKIESTICGHPALAIRFVDASIKHGLEELLDNSELRSQIGYELKVKWLLDNYPLEENEKHALEILALFNSELPDSFIKNSLPNPHSILENLVNRYLVDVHFYKDGTSKYFVPNLIKDYIKGISKPDTLKKNHLLIADYFWNKAEDITVSSYEKISSYRKAFYHFRESGNHEKLKLLVIRFREKFIIEAMESAREKLWHDAYFYFNELHSHNQIGIDNPREYNQFIKVLSRIKLKPKNTSSLIEEIHKMFPADSFIAVTYADYLFDKGDYIQSKEECLRIKNLLLNDKTVRKDILSDAIIDNTLAKCEFKLDNIKAASDLVDKWKLHFAKKPIKYLNAKEKYHYQSLLMTEYEGLNCYEEYLNKKKSLVNELMQKNDNKILKSISFLNLANRYTHCLEGDWQEMINKQFEITKMIRKDEKLISSENNFKKHIFSQSDLQEYLISVENLSVSVSAYKLIDDINYLLERGKSILQQVKNIDVANKHFQSNYALCSFLQVEADFHLLQKIFSISNNHVK